MIIYASSVSIESGRAPPLSKRIILSVAGHATGQEPSASHPHRLVQQIEGTFLILIGILITLEEMLR
jgi:hypothetical protein